MSDTRKIETGGGDYREVDNHGHYAEGDIHDDHNQQGIIANDNATINIDKAVVNVAPKLEERTGASQITSEINELEKRVGGCVRKLRNKKGRILKGITDTKNMKWLEELKDSYREALGKIASDISRWMNAERTTVYFVNSDRDQLWSIYAQGDNERKSLDIRLDIGSGIAGRVAKDGRIENIPYPASQHKYSEEILRQDKKNKFKTHTLLTIPIFDEDENGKDAVFSVIQLVNKKAQESDRTIDEHEEKYYQYARNGFTKEDCKRLRNFVSRSSIKQMLASLQDYYNFAQQFKRSIESTEAVQKISGLGNDFSYALQKIMSAAKDLMSADRSTLWILDYTGERLWTEIPSGTDDGQSKEISIEVGKGFAGKTAQPNPINGEYEILNIPCDVYGQKDSETARESDKNNGYRTCSLLCVPVVTYDNKSGSKKLLGVTQLLNKTRDGFDVPSPEKLRACKEVPDCFNTSFTQDDERQMRAFNSQVALILRSPHKEITQEASRFLKSSFNHISEFISEYFPCKSAVIYINDEPRNTLVSLNAENSVFDIKEYKFFNSKIRAAVFNRQDSFESVPALSKSEKYDSSCLVFPFVYDKRLLAVIEVYGKFQLLLAKERKSESSTENYRGFSRSDKENFLRHQEDLFHLIKVGYGLYKTLETQKSASRLREAQQAVLNEKFELRMVKVMEEARKLVNADRCTLWKFDKDNQLFTTEGYVDQGGLKEIELSVSVGKGYVGELGESVIGDINSGQEEAKIGILKKVDCDLYETGGSLSKSAKSSDLRLKYRTCSLLCMAIINREKKLLGILQLVNKLQQGFETKEDYSEYLEAEKLPQCFNASFTQDDVRQLEQFNQLVGVLIYEDIAFDEVRRLADL